MKTQNYYLSIVVISAPLQLFLEDCLQKIGYILSHFLKDVTSSIFPMKLNVD